MPKPTVYRDRLSGKSAIVTGAGSDGAEIGIGRAIALLLAAEGANVTCVDLSEERAAETVRLIHQHGAQAIAVGADVTSPSDCQRVCDETVRAFGGIDVLVNNVGIAGQQMDLANADMSQWRLMFDTNLTSAMLMSKAALPQLQAGGGGSIVNISSIAGKRAMGSLAYGPSKAALHQLSRGIGVAHGRAGIRANTVAPGHLLTPMAMRLMPPEMRETRRKINPLGLEGDAWDVAQAVLFLSSDEARFINGVELAVDGGVEGIGALAGVALVNSS